MKLYAMLAFERQSDIDRFLQDFACDKVIIKKLLEMSDEDVLEYSDLVEKYGSYYFIIFELTEPLLMNKFSMTIAG
jgi:hypothetical protein